ncbi:MAG: hypothetical protein HY011_25935 [Acidobacteria bacterium]|nr:hypothetical protein [Acidobacteriota bacterium]
MFANSRRRLVALPTLALVALWAGACTQHAGPTADSNAAMSHAEHAAASAPQVKATPRVPDHFLNPDEAKPFPVTLDPKTFTTPSVIKAYQLAKDIPAVLAQQPCYCYCDAGSGHKSLLHCHVDDHSAT